MVRRSTAGGVQGTAVTIAPLAAAALLWGVSLRTTDPFAMTDLGLVSVLPPTYFLALTLLIAGFVLSLHRADAPTWSPPAYIVGWIVALHATPAILYGTLRYSWAWKHVGIVDYIQRTGRIDPAIDNLPIYHNWPGFFGAATLLAEVAGLPDALTIASWAPFAFELLFAALVLLIFRTATTDPRLIWFGVWTFSLTNWVGQDYFAPQPLAYAAYLAVAGICLWAFAEQTPLATTSVGRRLQRVRPLARLVAQVDGLVERGPANASTLPPVSDTQRRGLLSIVVLLLVVIAVSHQLTPVLGVLALTALVLFRRCRVRWLPAVAVLFTAAWLATGASDFAATGLREVVASFGQPESNIEANLIDPSQFSAATRLVSSMARVLTAAVVLLAAAGFVRRLWHGYLDLPLVLLGTVPILLLGASGYGGEILFRVFFYALPFTAFFAAALIYPIPQLGARCLQAAFASIVSLALAIGFLFAYYGHERANFFRPGEVAAAEYLAQVAPPGSLVVEVSFNYPSRFRNYEYVTHVSLIAWARGSVEESTNPYSAAEIEEILADPRYPATYLVVTRSQQIGLSVLSEASLAGPLGEITSDADIVVLLMNDDAAVYGLADRQPSDNP